MPEAAAKSFSAQASSVPYPFQLRTVMSDVAAPARRSASPDDAATASPDVRRVLKRRRLISLAMIAFLFLVLTVSSWFKSSLPPLVAPVERRETCIQFFFA